jgi:hypothetical protein
METIRSYSEKEFAHKAQKSSCFSAYGENFRSHQTHPFVGVQLAPYHSCPVKFRQFPDGMNEAQ